MLEAYEAKKLSLDFIKENSTPNLDKVESMIEEACDKGFMKIHISDIVLFEEEIQFLKTNGYNVETEKYLVLDNTMLISKAKNAFHYTIEWF